MRTAMRQASPNRLQAGEYDAATRDRDAEQPSSPNLTPDAASDGGAFAPGERDAAELDAALASDACTTDACSVDAPASCDDDHPCGAPDTVCLELCREEGDIARQETAALASTVSAGILALALVTSGAILLVKRKGGRPSALALSAWGARGAWGVAARGEL